jgi:signal transduction histidine kinase/DNA-binding NarL/FixJ family response regulator
MLVFGTELTIVTFLISLFEMVFFFYQIVYYLSRPSDKHRLYYLILLYLLIQHNIVGNLLPDPNIPINIMVQNIIAYLVAFAMAMYFPFYFYKVFKLEKLRFYAYGGSVIYLLVPFVVAFIIPYVLTGNLELSRRLVLIVPFFYSLSFLYSLTQAIKVKNAENKNENTKGEITAVFIGLVFWLTLPIIVFFETELNEMLEPILHFYNGSQIVEVISTNTGLLIMTILFIKRSVKQSRDEYVKLQDSEKQLQELNKDLVQKVKERTHELELLNDQRTNTFINLTHETKTPLTLINNYLNEYIKKHGESEELRIIKFSTEKLSRDIVNLFDLERYKRGDYAFNHEQVCNFSQILKNNITLFKPYASTKQIEINEVIEDNIHIQADPESVSRVINNLIENAIKYTNEKGNIAVTLSLNNNTLSFVVKDNGIGIPAELQSKIFEPYYQINTEKKNYQGMGMGLAIVKQIIDSLKGTIQVNNHAPQGTEVIVSLTNCFIDANTSMPENTVIKYYFPEEQVYKAKETFNDRKRTVLIVEDNIPLLNYMAGKIEEFFNVHIAINGLEAIEKLKSINHLDIIVSDVMMDKLNGWDLYKAIAQNDRMKHIPFIFITAKATAHDKIQGLALGAIDYIEKPFLIEELINKIDAVLNNLEQQRIALINSAFKNILNNHSVSITQAPANPINEFAANCEKYGLTSREIDIVKLIAKGDTYKSIADALFISDKTVAKHMQNIFEKASVSNKLELLNKLKPEIYV